MLAAHDAACWAWAATWFGDDDVCTTRDKAGFIIGLLSVGCWALAEVPQLISNALEGGSEGISEALLWLWVFSDILDVVGCSISDTLPTMVATAWLYLVFTVLLLLQHIYYTRIRPPAQQAKDSGDSDARAPLLGSESDVEDDLVADVFGPPLPHLEARRGSGNSHTVYGSLRNFSLRRSASHSLSLSGTGRSLADSFIAHARRGAHADGSDGAARSFLRSRSMPKRLAGAAAATGSGASLLALLALLAFAGGRTSGALAGRGGGGGGLLHEGRAIAGDFLGVSYATWGAVCGWTMAVTFFIGRVPQVIKNWQRQSCAGLSVEMFAIVLLAAVTYCLSIIIRVRSWADMAPKLPFFTDAALGAALDVVILVQFFMYRDVDSDDGTGSDAGAPQPAGGGSGGGAKPAPGAAGCEAGQLAAFVAAAAGARSDDTERDTESLLSVATV